jgi:hypothetical protein
MSVSPSTTLFTERLDAGQRPASFLFSVLMHGLAGVLIWWGLINSPRIDPRAAAEHLLVRSIELNAIEQTRRSGSPERYYPAANSRASAEGSGPALLRVRAALRKLHAEHGPQTIIQPDLTKQITLPEKIQIPQVILWSKSRVVVKKLVPPPPQKPAAAQVKPAIDLPTEEANLGDLSISSRPAASQKQMLLPSSSSPVAVERPEKNQVAPTLQAQSNAQPTHAAVLAISDERMSGTATLPPVSESAGSDAGGELKPGDAASSSQPSNSSSKGAEGAGTAANGAEKAAGDGAAKIAGNGAGKTSDDAEKSASGNGASKPGAVNHAGAATDGNAAKVSASGSPLGSSAGNTGSTRISQPRNGQFNSVVVGDQLSESYPETNEVWSGRIVYTVYLHVGLAKSWILQYARPRADDAAAAGAVARLVAPWPYDIVRPDLAPGAVDADALMVHGFIDPSGRFELLHIVFPADFPGSEFVLKSLAQWQFRPAQQDGQAVRVEVLLVIPGDEE